MGSPARRPAVVGLDADELRGASVEFFWAERFGEKVVGPQLHGARVLLLFARGGEDDRWNPAPALVGSHRGEHVEAAEMRHHEVEQYERHVSLVLEHVQRLASVVRKRDVKRTLLELHLDDAAAVRLVVRDEHMASRGGHGCQTRAAICSRLRRSSKRSWPMFARADTRTSKQASGERTDTIAIPSRYSTTVVRSSPRPLA